MKYWETKLLIKYPSNSANCRKHIDDIQNVVKAFNSYYSSTQRYKGKLIDVFNHGFTLVIAANNNNETLNGHDVKLISKRLADSYGWMEMSTQANKLFSVSSNEIEVNEFNEAMEVKVEQEELVEEVNKESTNAEMTPEIRNILLQFIYGVDVLDNELKSQFSEIRIQARHEINRILLKFL
ncbi:hypothetical protein H1230_16765 [Paenibacillus sp. 19GGS1-52]|uniref:hypothetical protein n=1 Tax=Paenibacillus sp. 19GGS1-52 TaxID=2758563 RepID=UPI001EFB0ECE|nr:hypothetical protein [Paenibacillus sp. 19GGS1-52]ULO04801.1 hypothetical protein H1230_16765 [Paenibacillus sp. 19GGS1-52]